MTALIKDVCVSVRVSVCVCMGVCGEGTWRGGEKRENSGEYAFRGRRRNGVLRMTFVAFKFQLAKEC